MLFHAALQSYCSVLQLCSDINLILDTLVVTCDLSDC